MTARVLADGDEIRIGDCYFRFRLLGSSARQSQAPVRLDEAALNTQTLLLNRLEAGASSGLALGIMGLAALDVWGTWGRPLRLARLPTAAGLALVTVAISVTVLRIPSLRHPAKLAAMRLLPGLLGASGGVTELRSLIVDGYGHYSLIPPLQQFGLAYLIALLGLLLLIQFAFKRVDAGKLLILIWGLATFILSIGQLRMTYYYAVVVALLTGYVADRLIATGRKTALVTVAFLILGVFAPTLYAVSYTH